MNWFYQVEMETHGRSSVLLQAPVCVMPISRCYVTVNLYGFLCTLVLRKKVAGISQWIGRTISIELFFKFIGKVELLQAFICLGDHSR